MENDIFVFHTILLVLFDRVKLPRNNERDRPCGHGVGFEIDRDRTDALLDIDQLHFIMPVQRYVREVERNRAGVSDIGE